MWLYKFCFITQILCIELREDLRGQFQSEREKW